MIAFIDSILLSPFKFMFWDFKFTVTNPNLPKCRIAAEFFYETPIRAFFRGFQTNCTTRIITAQIKSGSGQIWADKF